MGCLDFWMINSFIGGVVFFILFLIVDTQYPFYPYAVAGTHDDPDKKGSATACIIASCFYFAIGIGLLFWLKSREKRILLSQEYPRLIAGVDQAQNSYQSKSRSMEL